MSTAAPRRHSWEIWAALALSLLWLWLVSARVRVAFGGAGMDDLLYVRLAAALADGRWLGGVYDQLILAKGPFYPLWIAACFKLNLPLQFAESVLYAGACSALVVALAPILRRPALRLGVLALLLFSPGATAGTIRVMRECVYPALTLLGLAGAMGVALRADSPWRSTWMWAGLAGFALAAFVLCREERIWIVPALLPLIGYAVKHRASWRDLLITCLIGFVSFSIPVGAVMAKNRWHYGVAVITDFTGGPFERAYAALGRVRHATFRRYLPLPMETMRRIDAVSPRFAELWPYFEGQRSAGTKGLTCSSVGVCDEIAAGWMAWALRDAVDWAGHYRKPRDAGEFWTAVAKEVDAACASGKLACHRGTGSFLPPWHTEYGPLIVAAFGRAASYLVHFQDLSPEAERQSYGTPAELARFQDVTRDRIAPSSESPDLPLPRQTRHDRDRLEILSATLVPYRTLAPFLAAATLVALVAVAAASTTVRRWIRVPLSISASLLLSLLARLAILAVLDATSFPAVNTLYLAPAYPLLIAFIAVTWVGILELVSTWASLATGRRNRVSD